MPLLCRVYAARCGYQLMEMETESFLLLPFRLSRMTHDIYKLMVTESTFARFIHNTPVSEGL